MMRAVFLVLLITSPCICSVGSSAPAQNQDLNVAQLAEILGVTTWRIPVSKPLGHDLAAGLLFLPAGSVYEQSKFNLYADKLRITGRQQVLFVVRERDDGFVQIGIKTPQGSTSRKFLPPRSWTTSISYPVDEIEPFADKLVLMRFLDENNSPVAAIAYWFERTKPPGP